MKKIIGISFSMASAVLALVALFFYWGVPRNTTTVLILLGIAIAVAVVDIVTSEKLPSLLRDCFPIAKTVLIAAALVISFIPQVNQIGYVIAGLDGISSLISFIVAASITGASLLVSIIVGFIDY